MNKHNNALIRARHCTIYTLGFIPLLFILHIHGWMFFACLYILFWSHFIEDTYYPVFLWAKYIRRPQEMTYLISDKKEDVNRKFINSKFEQNIISAKEAQRELDMYGFKQFIGTTLGKILMIAIDQIIHIFFLLIIILLILL